MTEEKNIQQKENQPKKNIKAAFYEYLALILFLVITTDAFIEHDFKIFGSSA